MKQNKSSKIGKLIKHEEDDQIENKTPISDIAAYSLNKSNKTTAVAEIPVLEEDVKNVPKGRSKLKRTNRMKKKTLREIIIPDEDSSDDILINAATTSENNTENIIKPKPTTNIKKTKRTKKTARVMKNKSTDSR
eukprot:UN23891